MATVKEAKATARHWVLTEATRMPGFCGAFFHGSVNWLPENDRFPAHSDIDIIVVLDQQLPAAPGKFVYQQVLLEVSYLSVDALRSAEQVLGTYYLAGSFKQNSIIADPSNRLTGIQQEVAEAFAKRHWVEQRCENASRRASQFLSRMEASAPLHEQVTSWLFARGVMAQVLLVAALENPTVRKRYVSLKAVLSAYGMQDFYEQLLALSGFGQLSRQEVEQQLHQLDGLFTVACSVIRSPYHFAGDISAGARPVTIDGSYALIETGLHREAMFWIVASYCRCLHVLHQDAAPEIKEPHDHHFLQLLQTLGISTYADRVRENEKARQLLPLVQQKAAAIIAINPAIQ